MAGVVDLAHAVSCSDVVDQVSGTTYSSALGQFLYINGKTYAISRSAVTGNANLPDGYFAFDPNITREYIFDGVDTASLKEMLQAGKFGAARPLTIQHSATEEFILKHYGKHLQAATGANGTLVNAWKNYSSSYTTISGSSLSYTNWATPPVETKSPQAVAMGNDGKWVPITSGRKLSQIVEFDGKLDCAIDMTPGPSPPADPPQSPPLDPSLMKDFFCGKDFNGNGNVGEPGELFNCLKTTTAIQGLCPIDDVACNAVLENPSCPNGFDGQPGTINTGRMPTPMCQVDAQISCPSTGAFVANPDLCYKDALKDCPAGYTYVAANNRCEERPQCSAGTVYNDSSNKCEWTATYEAIYTPPVDPCWCYSYGETTGSWGNGVMGIGTWGAGGECVAVQVNGPEEWVLLGPQCPGNYSCTSGGTLSGTACIVTNQVNPTCPGGDFQDNGLTGDVCFTPYNLVCNDPAFVVQVPGQPDQCQSPAIHNCPAGTTWIGLPVAKCEAVPICNQGIYIPQANSCYNNQQTCPFDATFQCFQKLGDTTESQPGVPMQYCSPFLCVDSKTAPNAASPMDESYYQNDGPKDEDGNCLGTIYIFSAKPSRCRPPGLVVGMINDCCEPGGQVMDEDTGGNIQTAVSAVKTLYNVGTVAYATYLASTGSEGMVAAGEMAVQQGGVVSNAIAASMEAIAQGANAATAFGEGLTTFVSGMMTSPAIIVGIVVMVAMKVIMGGGCDAGDIQTTMARDSGLCHYVGDFCYKKWALVGCTQQARGYCCYNSKLARIIAEQGRPQLTVFGPDGGWGTANAPNCRGFTPEEFQSIDFNRIDLTEYYTVLEKDLGDKLTGAQNKVKDVIQNKVQQVTP